MQDAFQVQIRSVSNGYMVIPNYSHNCDTITDTHVFESFDNLVKYLRGYLPLYPVDDGPSKRR